MDPVKARKQTRSLLQTTPAVQLFTIPAMVMALGIMPACDKDDNEEETTSGLTGTDTSSGSDASSSTGSNDLTDSSTATGTSDDSVSDSESGNSDTSTESSTQDDFAAIPPGNSLGIQACDDVIASVMVPPGLSGASTATLASTSWLDAAKSYEVQFHSDGTLLHISDDSTESASWYAANDLLSVFWEDSEVERSWGKEVTIPAMLSDMRFFSTLCEGTVLLRTQGSGQSLDGTWNYIWALANGSETERWAEVEAGIVQINGTAASYQQQYCDAEQDVGSDPNVELYSDGPIEAKIELVDGRVMLSDKLEDGTFDEAYVLGYSIAKNVIFMPDEELGDDENTDNLGCWKKALR